MGVGSLQAVDELRELFLIQRHLCEDAEGALRGESLEVLLTRRNKEARHIEGAWRDDILFVALGIVAVRTMLGAQEDDGEVFIAITPADDIHHRLDLIGA